MKHMGRLLMFMVLLAGLCSCSTLGPGPLVGPVWKQDFLLNGPPGSPPKFQHGWRDGCETSISSTGNTFQKMFHGFKQDSSLVLDPEYYAGWKSASDYCKRYIWNWLDTQLVAGEAKTGLSIWGTTSFWGVNGKNE